MKGAGTHRHTAKTVTTPTSTVQPSLAQSVRTNRCKSFPQCLLTTVGAALQRVRPAIQTLEARLSEGETRKHGTTKARQ